MIITGIHDILQIQGKNALRGVGGGEKRISITLYDQIVNEPNADELADRILRQFSDERGAYKRTCSRRFEEFDESVMSYLKERFSREDSVIVQDVGVSDGRTSCDFFEKLAAHFRSLTFCASDYSPRVVVIEKGCIKVTLSPKNRVLESVWPPFVFNAVKKDSRLRYPLNWLIQFLVEYLIVKGTVAQYLRGDIKARELLLFAPRALSLARQDERFQLGQHDLATPCERASHIIRAMNVLNPTYFTEKEFLSVIANVHSGLLESGFFITGSNQDAGSPVNGGIYQKTASGFQRTWRSGDGSPIDEKILTFRAH